MPSKPIPASRQRTAAVLASTLRRLRSAAADAGRAVVVVDAGRSLAPDATSHGDNGRTMLAVLAAGGCDVFVPSAMDLSIGLEQLDAVAREATLPVVSSWATGPEPGSHLVDRVDLDLGQGLRLTVSGLLARGRLDQLAAAGGPRVVDRDPKDLFIDDEPIRLLVARSAGHGSRLISRELSWSLIDTVCDADLVIDPDLGQDLVVERRGEGLPRYLRYLLELSYSWSGRRQTR